MTEGTKNPSDTGKETAFYSGLVSAWVQTRMERDKALIALSSAGIGLLVTLAATTGVTDFRVFLLYCLSFLGLVVTVFSCLQIYQRNAQHIEKVVKGHSTKDLVLEHLDKVSGFAFFLGVGALVALGVLSALLALVSKGSLK